MKAIYGNPLLGFGDDWIDVGYGYTLTREEAMGRYDAVREVGGAYKHLMLQLQEATFSYELGHESKDCR